MRRATRINLACLALAAPAAALVALGVHFLVAGVPRIVANEHRRAQSASKSVTYRLKDGSLAPDFVWEYGRGVTDARSAAADWARARFPATLTWKDWNTRGAKKRAEMWGFMPLQPGLRDGSRRLVWVRDGRRVLAKATDIEETNFRAIFYLGGPLVLAVLVGLTAFAVGSLRASVRARDDFLAATAHDLATPLVAMRHLIGRDDAEARDLNERLLRLVGNITGFLRHGGRRRFAREPFDLARAFAEAYRPFAADYRDTLPDGADLPLDTPDGSHPLALADETATVQIIWNLLGNDLKYAAPFGSVRARVSRTPDGFARLELVDEGPGLTPRQMRRASDRYWRARTVLESGKGGFGIGLCVAREMAEAMGGALTVEANTPRGCVFTLLLPTPPDDESLDTASLDKDKGERKWKQSNS